MKIVIDIPEEDYKRMIEQSMFGRADVWRKAIQNGTPLPDGAEMFTIDKRTLKAVAGRFVIYDREWLKEHFNTTEAYLYGGTRAVEHPEKRTEERTKTHACDCKTHGRTHACDCISRQAVSDIIKTRLYQTALNNTECITSYDKVCEDIAENRIDTWINEAKSVEPEQNLQPTCNQLATDCISRQDVLDLAESGKLVSNDNYKSVRDAINGLPSVEPERKPGKWMWDKRTGEYECSECGCNPIYEGIAFDYSEIDKYRYCRWCGARMEVDG